MKIYTSPSPSLSTAGLGKSHYQFAKYLEEQQFTTAQIKLKFQTVGSAQTCLDYYYPQDGTCIRENENLGRLGRLDKVTINNFGKKRGEIIQLAVHQQNLTDTLNLTGFSKLEELYCHNNKLTNLILPNNNQLRILYCNDNQLTSLDLSNYIDLQDLRCSSNQLTQLILASD